MGSAEIAGSFGSAKVLAEDFWVRRRGVYANPLYSTPLAQGPGAVLGIAGWVLSSPEQWTTAAGVGLFFVGLTLVTWRIRQREAERLGKEIDLLG